MANEVVIDVRLSRNRNYWDYTRVSNVDGQVLRTALHIDHAYKEQSRGTVSLWTPNGWTEVSTHPGVELHKYHTFPSPYSKGADDEYEEDFGIIANILEDPALRLLSLAAVREMS